MPNDPTNQGRVFLTILQDTGLIKLKDNIIWKKLFIIT
ncbi:MAG: hypothetical protein AB8V03_00290 [Francisella endosymbiont of Hyalomma asiaticum]